MKPIDLRNANFEQLRAALYGQRKIVLQAWTLHGPGTVREIAAKSGWDILSFAPRTTELFQIGALFLYDTEPETHRGIYKARRPEAWEAWLAAQRAAKTESQLQLA